MEFVYRNVCIGLTVNFRETKTQRLGFLKGEIVVPDDFNPWGEAEIAALFGAKQQGV